MLKDFLFLHFTVGQVLSISGYDLENGRTPCKQKYCIKNIAVEIQILILFRFCYFVDLKTIYFTSIVAESCFKYIGPCRWFQLILDGFSSFQMILGHFRLFQIVLARSSDGSRWFQLLFLDGFKSFQIVLGRFNLFLTLVSTKQNPLQRAYLVALKFARVRIVRFLFNFS